MSAPERRNAERRGPSLVRRSMPSGASDLRAEEADRLASELFDQALSDAGLTTKEVAYLLGVSDSLVMRMRSPEIRGRVSFTQLLRLPPAFHIALHRRLNARFGFGRAALRDLLEGLGTLALLTEAR